MHFRYLALQTHYHKALNFSLENLEAAKTTYQRLERKISETRKQIHKGIDNTKEYESTFLKAINNDLNLPMALDLLWKVLDDFDFSPKKKIRVLEKFDSVLGLGIKDIREKLVVPNKQVQSLIRTREKLRKQKKWAEADIIRQRILEQGYRIEDAESGSRLERI